MLSFTDQSLESIKAGKSEYRVNLSFDNVIKAMGINADQDLSSEQKLHKLCDLLIIDDVSDIPDDGKAQIIQVIFSDINQHPYGNDDPVVDDSDADYNAEQQPTVTDFDYEQDAGAIYASFLMQYGIDLTKELGVMHWDRFKALFDGLDPDTYLQKIRQYRGDDLSGYGEHEEKQKQFVMDMQDYYMLDSEKNADPFASLGSLFNQIAGDKPKGG